MTVFHLPTPIPLLSALRTKNDHVTPGRHKRAEPNVTDIQRDGPRWTLAKLLFL